MQINLKAGTIAAHDFTLTANGSGGNFSLSSADMTYPLKIGENFSVKWDGTLNATSGVFSGEINATTGKLGGLEVTGDLTVTSGSLAGGSGNNPWSINSSG